MTMLLIKNLLKWFDQTNPWIGQWYSLSGFVESPRKYLMYLLFPFLFLLRPINSLNYCKDDGKYWTWLA